VDSPVIYIFHGDDEFAINELVSTLEEKVRESDTSGMNITRLDGAGFVLDNLVATTQAMPFLSERRLVILINPLGSMKSQKIREQFLSVLENIPETTALVLQINRPLVSTYEKRKGVRHWLQKWADNCRDRVFEKECLLPQGQEMVNFIQRKAKEMGGDIDERAAYHLAEFVNDNPRLAVLEIEKLLVYVDCKRPVEIGDVEKLTPNQGEANVFKMVDALSNRDSKIAQKLLNRLLEDDDPLRLFGMIVRQYRLLLLTKELSNNGYGEAEIAKKLKIFPFVSRKLINQVRNYSVDDLKNIYHQLLQTDLSIKTGKVEGGTAIDILVSSLTNQ